MRNLFLALLLCISCSLALAQEPGWGVVNVSVCNTRSDADYNAGMESQALLGMPVRVLDTKDEWTKIQTPEGYESWTLSGTVTRMEREEVTRWNQSPQVVVTSLYGNVYEEPSAKSQPVSDIVAGDRLRLLKGKGKFYLVEYPDGRKGYLPKANAEPIGRWREKLDNSAESILRTAHQLMGVPYMWGGTSPKGVDCSGFVRTTLYMHDIIIPRNASQQARKGERLETGDFANLRPGDLLFFGRKAEGKQTERVIHVAFYLGEKRFIHSMGYVRIGSFDPQDPLYDEYNHNRLLFAARILPYINMEEGLFTTDKSEYYK